MKKRGSKRDGTGGGTARKRETPEECTLRARKGQYRDKVEWITYRIPGVHTEKENGKCHVAVAADRADARSLARSRAHWRDERVKESRGK